MKVTAIILAGGLGKRLGYVTKASLKIGEQTFIDRIIDACDDFDEVIVVRRSNQDFAIENKRVKVVEDLFDYGGPMTGIFTGMHHASHEITVVLPCDIPLIQSDVLKTLVKNIGEKDGAVPIIDGYKQCLCAVYNRRIKDGILEALENKHFKISKFIETLDIEYLDEDAFNLLEEVKTVFTNVNDNKTYQKL